MHLVKPNCVQSHWAHQGSATCTHTLLHVDITWRANASAAPLAFHGDHACVCPAQFYADRAQFDRDMALARKPRLQHVLHVPFQICGNSDGKLRGPGKFAWPPCTITARGEPLAEWAPQATADLPMAIFVLLHIAERLQLLHAAGLAHRALSPASTAWLERENTWRLTGIGTIAAAGAAATEHREAVSGAVICCTACVSACTICICHMSTS